MSKSPEVLSPVPATKLFGTHDHSIQDQLEVMSPEELMGQLHLANKKLGKLGVSTPMNIMFGFAARFGHMYEDRRYGKGKAVIRTPINCLEIICHDEPVLRHGLEIDQFDELLAVVSQASIAYDVLLRKTEHNMDTVQWPEEFDESPMNTLPYGGEQVPKPFPPINPLDSVC